MFAIVICFVLLMCTFTIRSSVLCVLMVEVNVMLTLISVMSPPPALCNISVLTVVKLCIFGVFALGVSWVPCIVIIHVATFICVICMFSL